MSVRTRLDTLVHGALSNVKQLRVLRTLVFGIAGATPRQPLATAGDNPDRTVAATTGPGLPGQATSGIRGPPGHAARSAWGFTGALLVIVLGLVMLVDELHDREDLQRQAQVMASELEQDAAELRVAVEALMAGQKAAAAVVEINDELADLAASSTMLRELSDDDAAAGIAHDLRAADSALRAQLAALGAGELEAAEEVDDLRTQPALDALDARIEAANDHYAIAAGRSSKLSDMGLWVALLAAGLAIGGLSWRHERARRASQAALEQRLRERVVEVAEITERHRQLEALKYSFVTAVSHELRTPLTAIHGSLEMLEDGDVGQLTPAVSRVVSVAARGTRRLSRLVEDIIDLERLESGLFGFQPAPHDLHALLVETVESLAPLTDRAGVELVLHETHADVLCDGDRVLQAMTNLVGNAIKFTSPAGTIDIEAVRGGEEVEVTVRDQGRGIPTEELDAIFDRFHQVDSAADQAKGGAGLGLTITRHIIEAHGGRIWAESRVGAGTAFHFTLPLALPEPHDPETLTERRPEPIIL